jgi:hypothetical protein
MGIPIIRLPLGKELSSATVCDESFGAFILVNADCLNQNQLITHEYTHILQGEKAHINAEDCPKAVPLQSRTSRPVSNLL